MSLLVDDDSSSHIAVDAPRPESKLGPDNGVIEVDAPQPDPSPGPDDGVIEEARHRQRRRRTRAGFGVLIAIVALGAILLAARGGGGDATHKPATDPKPTLPHVADARHTSINVHISPIFTGGEAGWCVAAAGGAACGGVLTAGSPMLSAGSSFNSNSRYSVLIDVVAPRVAAVLVNGHRRVSSVAVPGLPYGLRAVRVLTPTIPNPRRPGYYLPPRHEPTLVALDASGHRFAHHRAPGEDLAPVSWQRPQPPAEGACQLHAAGLPGLSAEWGHVATAVQPYPATLIAPTFLSCMDTEYYLRSKGKRSAMDVAVLLNAADPGRRPAQIPGLKPMRGAHGYFSGPGTVQGALTATRRGDAWLVITGTKGPAQRLRVLRHLSATVTL